MSEINTANDWWDSVNDDDKWSGYLAIIFHHLDPFNEAYEEPGSANTAATGRNIADELEYLRKNRDPRLARYFGATWSLASDAYAWSVPYWGEFCDLCSESHVLEPEEESRRAL